MKRLLPLLLLAACSIDPPPVDTTPPELGERIFDRAGRAAVNTALVGIFEARGAKNDLQQRYNEAGPSDWPAFAPEIAESLPVFDALDAVCGNQTLAGPDAAAGRYDALAGVLAEDRLYVNTDADACTQYLAVELNATQIAPNQDCGGRTPTYDVIDVTYSVLAAGATSGVPDGIDADRAPPAGDFPFFVR